MATEKDPALEQEEVPTDETVTEAPEVTEENGEGAADSTETTEEAQKETSAEEFELVVGGEQPAAAKEDTPEKIKARNAEFARMRLRNAELERELAARNQPAVVPDPGKKPTLEDCDYNTADFEAKLDTWHEARRRKEAADTKATQEAQQAQTEWQKKQLGYAQSREQLTLKLPNFQELEKIVDGALNDAQRGIILKYAKNPALVVAALGRDPERLTDFARMSDLGSYIYEIAQLEAKTSMKPKSTVPPPEKPVRGTGAPSGKVDTHLEALERQAAKTGDRTEIGRYLSEKRRQERQRS